VPAVPTDLSEDESLTDDTKVTFTWTAPTDDGGSPITSFCGAEIG